MTADEAILENHAAAREQEKFAEAHRALDAQGVSHSVYGQAARESVLRARFDGHMTKDHGPIMVVQSERTFTRAEVLSWLKGRKALLDAAEAPTAARATISALINDFERME